MAWYHSLIVWTALYHQQDQADGGEGWLHGHLVGNTLQLPGMTKAPKSLDTTTGTAHFHNLSQIEVLVEMSYWTTEKVSCWVVFFFFFPFKDSFEIESMQAGGGAEGKNLKQTTSWAWNQLGAQSHNPEIMTWAKTKSGMLNQLNHLRTKKKFFFLHTSIVCPVPNGNWYGFCQSL